MKLAKWLWLNKLTGKAFAKRAGLPQPVVSRVKNGVNTPTLRVAVAIERATKGQVRAEDFL